MSVVSTTKMTAQQFLLLGDDPPGVRLELVDGEIAVSPSPGPDHSFVDTRLRRILDSYVDAHDLGIVLGDVDTIFGAHDVRRPDVIYFSKDRCHLVGKKSLTGPPDLCVEILSPSSIQIDRKDKFKQYAKSRVRHYWVVDPEHLTIQGYRLAGSKYRLAGSGKENQVVRLPPFPDLEIPLSKLSFPLSE